jgi:hypothetical protein
MIFVADRQVAVPPVGELAREEAGTIAANL